MMMSTRLAHRPGLRKLTGAFLATTALVTALTQGAMAQPAPPQGSVQDVVADTSGYGGTLALPIGGSRILRFSRPIGQVMVGNPKVGDVVPLGERTIYVLGKAAGPTSLTVMPRGGGAPLATLDVRVGYDVDNIRRAARDILPGEPLDVSSRGDGVVLTGVLSSSIAAARAAAVAEQYAPGHVVNLTSVRAAEQVMLSVRVAEVQRSALQQLGLNDFKALWDPTGSITLLPPAANPAAVANLLGKWTSGNWTFQSLFDALESHGFASTLAEPNLVALSGETAVFFAGGEFPVPVPQGGSNNNTITIEYKQYGVSIGFTPTVVGDSINLAVAPEVSALDYANSVLLQGFRIPGVTSRRAKTTIELRNGQSFAIAGLIKREFTDNLKGIPGAQRVPLFGSLFRSTGYQNNETEVMIIVTAHLAKPTNRQNLVAPTDVREGPSESDLLLMGTTDRAMAPGPTASLEPTSAQAAQAALARDSVLAPQRPATVAAPVVPPPPAATATPVSAPTPVVATGAPAAAPSASSAAVASIASTPPTAVAPKAAVAGASTAPSPAPLATAGATAAKAVSPPPALATNSPAAPPMSAPKPVAVIAAPPAPPAVVASIASTPPVAVAPKAVVGSISPRPASAPMAPAAVVASSSAAPTTAPKLVTATTASPAPRLVSSAPAPKPAPMMVANTAPAPHAAPGAAPMRMAPPTPVSVQPIPVATAAAPTTIAAKPVLKAELSKPALFLDPASASRAPAASTDR